MPRRKKKQEGWCLLVTNGEHPYQVSGIFSSYKEAPQNPDVSNLVVRIENNYYSPNDNFWLVRREDEQGVIYRVYSGEEPPDMTEGWGAPVLLAKLF